MLPQTKKQTNFKVLPRPTKNNNLYESGRAYEIKLKNSKKDRITVTIQEPISGD